MAGNNEVSASACFAINKKRVNLIRLGKIRAPPIPLKWASQRKKKFMNRKSIYFVWFICLFCIPILEDTIEKPSLLHRCGSVYDQPLGEMGPYTLLSLLMLCRVDADRILKTTGHFQTDNELPGAEVRLNLRGKMRLINKLT